jgi:hypothetical protein
MPAVTRFAENHLRHDGSVFHLQKVLGHTPFRDGAALRQPDDGGLAGGTPAVVTAVLNDRVGRRVQ